MIFGLASCSLLLTRTQDLKQMTNLVIHGLDRVRGLSDLVPQQMSVSSAKSMQSDSHRFRTQLQSFRHGCQ